MVILLERRVLLFPVVIFAVKELERLGVVTITGGGLLVTCGGFVAGLVTPPRVLFVEAVS